MKIETLSKEELAEAQKNVQELFALVLSQSVDGHPDSKAPTMCACAVVIHTDGNYTVSLAGQVNKGMLLGALTDAQMKVYEMMRQHEDESIQRVLTAIYESSNLPKQDLN